MKKLMLTAMVVTAFLFTTQTEGQVRLNVNLNMGRPSWGLPGSYQGDYYYLPEIDSYYDISRREFINYDGRDWVYNEELPYQYRDYDLFGGYKVIVNEPRPYLHADVYRQRYSSYYNAYRRPVIINQGYGGNRYPDYCGRYDNGRYDNDRYENDRYQRGRGNKNFDNKRRELEREGNDDNRGRFNGHDNGKAWGRKW